MEAKSAVSKALATVKVSERGLSKLSPENRMWTLQKRKVQRRDSIIYRDYVEAEDKEAVIDDLQERWGFQRRGDVLRIIEKGRLGVVPAMAAEVKVLRRVKREEVINDYDAYRAEIDQQLAKLRIMRRRGEKTVEVEITDTVGGKFEGTKTKKVRVDAEIRRLESEKAKSHREEAAALADYASKQADGTRDAGRGLEVATEFLDALERVARVTQKPDPIDIEAEVTNR